jgi:hypothetical protein
VTWIGRKKLALVPLFRPNAHPPDVIPTNWNDEILRRMLFDPDPTTGADRSLRAYIHTVSSGRADLDVVIQQMAVVDQQDVPPNILEATLGAQLRAQGFNAAAIVMLGGIGAGTNSGFWSRFVMVEGVGVWAMEFMHSLTGFADLYSFNGNMGAYEKGHWLDGCLRNHYAHRPRCSLRLACCWSSTAATFQSMGGCTHRSTGALPHG